MNEKQQIYLQLFLREQPGASLVERGHLDISLAESAEYQQWLRTRRDLTPDDITAGHWIKSCSGGYITEVIFHPDGTLQEYRLFDRFPTSGVWQLEDGLLKAEICKGDNTYCFAAVGNQGVNIHSAAEYKNGELHAYLKLAQVRP